MSIIPNCREKYIKDTLSSTDIDKKEINPYWYGLLLGKDAEYLMGYDFNTEFVVNNLFDNLDAFANELEEIGINIEELDTEIVNGASDTNEKETRPCKWYCEYSQEELDSMNNTTKMFLLFKYMLNRYIEDNRDMLVTSMIDNMNDKIYTKNYDKISKS